VKQAEFKALLLAECREQLVPLGFKKRSGEIFTRELADDFFGWLGLVFRTRLRPGAIGIAPTVGVHHPEIERLAREFSALEIAAKGPTATLARPLGYVMPEPDFRTWICYPDGFAAQLDDMVRAISRYGVPYMERHASLEEIVVAMPTGSLPPLEQAKRIALVRGLQGDRAAAYDALAPLRRAITDLTGAREDAMAFIERFSRHFNMHFAR
jgi:hypothetical protein